MSFIIYPLLFGLLFSLIKITDLWYSKKVAKTQKSDWRFSPHLIWILFLVGVVIGIVYVLITK